ncbi:hypothetical protein PLICRDRAFT_57382 [Plicaturopsis crispa FD-325 SS-3]|uniref:Proteophosphoglycan ppg4 n=1 Tax=Plicaturopsis crispa FD-325 SS-3 TaxID=944288 RepID=A0A0C9SY78_PLICR|nr:hypothetical protein PLICRDRAFT_57382 [Plicaturopsis crispa FD-325 SS-3]
MSRQPSPSPPSTPKRSSPAESPQDPLAESSEQQSSPQRASRSDGSEGYPSWLPRRPPHPAPASTFTSVGAMPPNIDAPGEQHWGGRKPTPRSVRIVSMPDSTQDEKNNAASRREPTDQTRVSNPAHQRVWSRATSAGMSPTVFGSASPFDMRYPRPRFRSTALHLELLRSPSWKSRLRFYLLPLIVFAHVPLQTFFDFNAVFILLQVAKFPNSEAPGVPGSGRNWTLGAAAYIACWAAWLFVVFIVYELIYSFYRRWRVKRPYILPLYFSSAAFNLVSMTSYSNFCFFQHLRFTAFTGENGSLRDGLAETFWFYSQNLPTVALLLPRAGLCVALLLAFSTPQPGVVALANVGVSRDGTFFHGSDGTLTNYARGILFANAAWTAWRALVLLGSWLGLWILSGQGCAGICGPRHRWEEDNAEKLSAYDDAGDEPDLLPWNWREGTRVRVQEAWDFCLTMRTPRWGEKKEASDGSELLPPRPPSIAPFDGMEQILAAVGFPASPPPARRGMLSEDLFDSPREEAGPELSDILPKVARRSSKDRQQVSGKEAPLMNLPYPFKGYGAQASSEDRIPFPPSPGTSENIDLPKTPKKTNSSGVTTDRTTEEEDEEDEEGEEEEVVGSEDPSSGRASGSMSSLGQPITSRYPFQFRRPTRGGSLSSGAVSHLSPQSHSTSSPSTNSHSTPSRFSRSTQSTGNHESSDSPQSHASPQSHTSAPTAYSPMPMPPRHPGQGRGRARAGTVPVPIPSSPSPVHFPRTGGRTHHRSRTASGATEAFGSEGPSGMYEPSVGDEFDEEMLEEMMEQPEPEGPHEAAEHDDSVGLLSSAGPSPKASFVSNRRGARSRSISRSNSHSGHSGSGSGASSSRSRTGSSISANARSRAQSMVQSFGAASRSSLELVQTAMRSRANSSMARLEEDMTSYTGSHSRSGSGSDGVLSSPENHTFGHPLRAQWAREEQEAANRISEERSEEGSRTGSPTQPTQPPPREPSPVASASASVPPSEHTASHEPAGIPIIQAPAPSEPSGGSSSHPDISTAAASFVTAPVTVEGQTDSSGRTLSSWGGVSHMPEPSGGTWRPA